MDLTGKLIIAPPMIKGTFWAKTATMITYHTAEGAAGLMLNKRSKYSLREFGKIASVELDYDGDLFVGGPSEPEILTMLHSTGWSCDNTWPINDDFCVSASDHILEHLADGDCPSDFRLFVGMTDWYPQQLEMEINGHAPLNHNLSWLVATPDLESVFGMTGVDLWERSLELSAEDFTRYIFAARPSYQ